MKKESIKIQHIEFAKDCAKGMSFSQFEKSFSAPAFDEIDKTKAFVILGGKIESKKTFKKKADKE